jgi:hypothetical protein
MAREANAALQAKILQVGFVSLLAVAALYATRNLMFGSRSMAGGIAFMIVGLLAVLLLDRRYWLLLPAFSVSRIAAPGLPFNGTEIGCLLIVVAHGFRLALRRDESTLFRRDVLVVFPMLGWMFIVWMLNPVGLAMFQSRVIGGRFYFDIAIGFLTFLSLASLRIDESDAKWLFYVLLVSFLFYLVRAVVFPEADPDSLVLADTGLEAEVSSRYAFITCSSIFVLLFAKWSVRDIVSSPFRLVVLLCLALLTVYSGKRQALGTIALVPFLRVFLKRRDVILTCSLTFLAAVLLIFAVAGDGTFYTLPRSVKRALAVVAPRYERETAGGIHDIFRQEMRKEAYSLIRENPWFGRKGFAMNLENTAWIHFGGGRTSSYASHAYAGNWHNMWLAYACDFGLPCLVLVVLFWIWLTKYVFSINRKGAQSVYLQTCCLFYSFELLTTLVFSWVSGHSSHSTYTTWIQYGFLIALVKGEQGNPSPRSNEIPMEEESRSHFPFVRTDIA